MGVEEAQVRRLKGRVRPFGFGFLFFFFFVSLFFFSLSFFSFSSLFSLFSLSFLSLFSLSLLSLLRRGLLRSPSDIVWEKMMGRRKAALCEWTQLKRQRMYWNRSKRQVCPKVRRSLKTSDDDGQPSPPRRRTLKGLRTASKRRWRGKMGRCTGRAGNTGVVHGLLFLSIAGSSGCDEKSHLLERDRRVFGRLCASGLAFQTMTRSLRNGAEDGRRVSLKGRKIMLTLR